MRYSYIQIVRFVASNLMVKHRKCGGIGRSSPLRGCRKQQTIRSEYADWDKAKLTVESSGEFKVVTIKESKKTTSKKTNYGKCETEAQANLKAKNDFKFMVKSKPMALKLHFKTVKDEKTGKDVLIRCNNCGLYAYSKGCLMSHFRTQKKD